MIFCQILKAQIAKILIYFAVINMENTNLSQNQGIPAPQSHQEQKSQQREIDRELKINDLTTETYKDLIPSKNAKIVEIIEDSPVKAAPQPQDEVQVFSPHLKERPAPLGSFANNQLPDFVKNTVKQLGFTTPTPIQNYCKFLFLWSLTFLAIPISLKGHDIISIAKTGSGKTYAFMIPCCIQINKMKTKMQQSNNNVQRMMMMNNPMACVLAPTRELAIQIYNASKMMTLMAGLRISVVYGGADRYSQIANLNRGCDILIATPGRLIDFLQGGNVNLGMVNYFVLDEADRMLVTIPPQINISLQVSDPFNSGFFSLVQKKWSVEMGRLPFYPIFKFNSCIGHGFLPTDQRNLQLPPSQQIEYVFFSYLAERSRKTQL